MHHKFLFEIEYARSSESFYTNGICFYEVSTGMGHGADPVRVGLISEAGVLRPEIPTELVDAYMASEVYINSMAVVAAIEKLKEMDLQYWLQTAESRLNSGIGSRTSYTTTEGIEAALKRAEWAPYSHPAIAAGCVGFITPDVQGKLGVEEISNISWYEYQEKGGKVFAVKKGTVSERANFTVAIVGPEGDLWTFHPGEPVRPSTSEDLSLVGTCEQGWKAKERGFTHAKIADK